MFIALQKLNARIHKRDGVDPKGPVAWLKDPKYDAALSGPQLMSDDEDIIEEGRSEASKTQYLSRAPEYRSEEVSLPF